MRCPTPVACPSLRQSTHDPELIAWRSGSYRVWLRRRRHGRVPAWTSRVTRFKREINGCGVFAGAGAARRWIFPLTMFARRWRKTRGSTGDCRAAGVPSRAALPQCVSGRATLPALDSRAPPSALRGWTRRGRWRSSCAVRAIRASATTTSGGAIRCPASSNLRRPDHLLASSSAPGAVTASPPASAELAAARKFQP